MTPTEKPATALLPALDRRSLLMSGVLGAGLAAAPLSARSREHGFTQGVASGEPAPDRVLLWTRFVSEEDTVLEWEVSETLDFGRIASAGKATATPSRDNCVKAWANGLEPGRWYYFRFIAPDGSTSDTGRTRTLPQGPTERIRLGVFSCSNIGFGWFNAYAHAAKADDIDLVIHTGDYSYEYPVGSYPNLEQAVRSDWLDPHSETVTLLDYRARYAAYRRDPDLRRLHQLFPMIAGWDDHESANDSWRGGAENHQPETEGYWQTRKQAAMRAYREWLPVSEEAWTEYAIGDLATLVRLETRLTSRDKPFDYAMLLEGKATPEEMVTALEAFREGDYADPDRTILGQAQEAWLAQRLKASKADGTRWQVLAQQVVMGELYSSQDLASMLTDDVPSYVREIVMGGALASAAGLPWNMDAWDGYPAARARLLQASLDADADLVVLAGDMHNAWAFELGHEGAKVGVEFAGQSVSSPGIEGYLPQIAPDVMARETVANNNDLVWAETSQRGYMMVELTHDHALSEYRFTAPARQRSDRLMGTKRFVSLAGSGTLAPG